MRLPNLLPQSYRSNYRLYLGSLYLRRFFYIQIVIAALLILAFGFHYYVLQIELNGLRGRSEAIAIRQNSANLAELQNLANSEADRMKTAMDILKVRPQNSFYIDELVKSLPTGVTLDTMNLDTAGKRLEIRGRAVTRDRVVALQENLESSPLFKVTYAPLANLTEPVNSAFNFILTLVEKK